MKNNSLKIYSHNGIIGNLTALLCGIAIIVIGIVASIHNELEIVLLCLIVGCVLVIISIMAIIYLSKERILIDDSTIDSYKNYGYSKSIKIDDLQRIIVYQVKRLGGKISRIILDDGSFSEDDDPRHIISNKLAETSSWIFLEFSNKRLRLLKYRFPNIKIEVINGFLN